MKWILILVVLLGASNITAQTIDEPKVCINQSAANSCASAVAQLIEARKAISEFTAERATSLAERQAAAKVIEGLNALNIVKDRVTASYEQINTLYRQAIDLQQTIILNLERQLNKPRSAFDKFISTLKTLAVLLAGVSLGRAF